MGNTRSCTRNTRSDRGVQDSRREPIRAIGETVTCHCLSLRVGTVTCESVYSERSLSLSFSLSLAYQIQNWRHKSSAYVTFSATRHMSTVRGSVSTQTQARHPLLLTCLVAVDVVVVVPGADAKLLDDVLVHPH